MEKEERREKKEETAERRQKIKGSGEPSHQNLF